MLNPARVTKPGIVDLFWRYTARGRNFGDRLAGGEQNRNLAAQVRDPPQDHVAVRWTDLDAVPEATEHLCGGDRRPASEERIEHHVAAVRERLDEELGQPAREGS